MFSDDSINKAPEDLHFDGKVRIPMSMYVRDVIKFIRKEVEGKDYDYIGLFVDKNLKEAMNEHRVNILIKYNSRFINCCPLGLVNLLNHNGKSSFPIFDGSDNPFSVFNDWWDIMGIVEASKAIDLIFSNINLEEIYCWPKVSNTLSPGDFERMLIT